MAVAAAVLLAFRLKLSEPVSHALFFGQCRLPVGCLVAFYLSLPVRQVTLVLFDNLSCFFESADKYLCVRITVVLQNSRDRIQFGGDCLLFLLNLLFQSFALLALE